MAAHLRCVALGLEVHREALCLHKPGRVLSRPVKSPLKGLAKVFERSYTRLQDVLANIGGFIKMLTTISTIINYPFFKLRLLQNCLFVINNYIDDFNYKNNKSQNNIILEPSKENMIHKFDPVVNIINKEKLNKIDKKIGQSKPNLNIFSYIKSYCSYNKNSLHDELFKFRNHILNEATIYELYFNYIILEKRFLNIAHKLNLVHENKKLNYEDVKLKYDRVFET